MANLTFIPTTTSKSTAASMLTIDDIPEDVRKDVEEVYTALKTQPGRMRVDFATVAELNTWVTQVQAYCSLRDGGPIRFRKSPTPKSGLKATQIEFRITDLKTENEQITDDVREATEAVKTAAKGK